MTVEKLIDFLSTLPKDLELDIVQPDCGGYDVELVPLKKAVVFKTDKMYMGNDVYKVGHYLADASCQNKDEKLF